MEFPFKRHQPEQIIEIVRGRFQSCDNCSFLSILACKGWQFRWTWTLVLNKRITRARVGPVSDKASLRHSIRYVLNFPMKLLSKNKARLAALPRSTVFMVVHRVRYFFEVRKSWLAPLHRDKPHFAGNCLRDKFTRKQHHPLWPRNHKVARLVSFCVGGWASFNVINYKPSSLDPLSCVCSGILALYVLLPLLMLLMPKWLSGKEKEPASLCPFCWFVLSRGSLFDKSLNLTAKKNTKKNENGIIIINSCTHPSPQLSASACNQICFGSKDLFLPFWPFPGPGVGAGSFVFPRTIICVYAHVIVTKVVTRFIFLFSEIQR